MKTETSSPVIDNGPIPEIQPDTSAHLERSRLYALRERALQSMMVAYKDHPQVQSAALPYRMHKGKYRDKFKVLEDEQNQHLFSTISEGIQSYNEGEIGEDLMLQTAMAANILIHCNQRLVYFVARNYFSRRLAPSLEPEDILHYGNLGLTKAMSRYDASLGYKFSSYAVFWINQSIQRSIADKSRNIRIPVHARPNLVELRKRSEEFFRRFGREATLAELVDDAESNEELASLYPYIADNPISLDNVKPLPEPVDEEDWEVGVMSEGISADDYPAPQTAEQLYGPAPAIDEHLLDRHAAYTIDEDEIAANVTYASAVERLFTTDLISDRCKVVLALRHGLRPAFLFDTDIRPGDRTLTFAQIISQAPPKPMTLDAVGKIFGVTRERIRQLEIEARKTLSRYDLDSFMAHEPKKRGVLPKPAQEIDPDASISSEGPAPEEPEPQEPTIDHTQTQQNLERYARSQMEDELTDQIASAVASLDPDKALRLAVIAKAHRINPPVKYLHRAWALKDRQERAETKQRVQDIGSALLRAIQNEDKAQAQRLLKDARNAQLSPLAIKDAAKAAYAQEIREVRQREANVRRRIDNTW